MNREQRIRRLFALQKTAAAKTPLRPDAPPPLTRAEEQALVDEWKAKERAGGTKTEESVQRTSAVPFKSLEKNPSQMGPLSSAELDNETLLWRTHDPAKTAPEEDADFYVLDPKNASEYEKYFGVKTPSGWKTTPISDLLFKLSTHVPSRGSGKGYSVITGVVDPSRGVMVVPRGHPYASRSKEITPLKKEFEDKIITNAPAIFAFMNAAGPGLGGKMVNKIRGDATLDFRLDTHGRMGIYISDSFNSSFIPFTNPSDELMQDSKSLNRALNKSVEDYPELMVAINELVEKVKGDLIREQYKINSALRFRGKEPGDIARARDIMINTILAKLSEELKKIDFQ